MAYTPDTGSLRINCLLISYLISKQVRLHNFKRVLVHLNLNVIGKKLVPLNTLLKKEKETFRFEDED